MRSRQENEKAGRPGEAKKCGAGHPAAAIGARSRGDGDLIRVLGHRRRREIMRILNSSDEPTSTREIEKALGQPRGNACHHIRVLRRGGLVALAATDDDVETFYQSRVKDRAAILIFLEERDRG